MVTTTNFIFVETLEISSSAIQKMVVKINVVNENINLWDLKSRI